MRNVLMAPGMIVVVAAAIASAPRSSAQSAPDPSVPIYFEAASVKPNRNSDPGGSVRRQPGGRFNAVNMPVRALAIFAYQIQAFQLVGGPAWAGTDRFDIVAKLAADPPPVAPGAGPDHMMLATRTLLADRFKLVVRRETRQMDIYALVRARPGGALGPALRQSTSDCSPAAVTAARRGGPQSPQVFCGGRMGPGRIQLGAAPLSQFANGLSGQVGRIVVDRTGLTGNWDFEITFAADPPRGGSAGAETPPVDTGAASLFTAIQEQLGLKLEPMKGPVEVLVIDSVQQPTAD
jgi:bla regulator protein blaR1